MSSAVLFFVQNSSTWLGLPSPWPQYRSNSEAHKECYKGPFAGETNSSVFSKHPLLWNARAFGVVRAWKSIYNISSWKFSSQKLERFYWMTTFIWPGQQNSICVSAFKPLKSKINPARSVPCLSTVLSNTVSKSMLWGEILTLKDIWKCFSSKSLIL